MSKKNKPNINVNNGEVFDNDIENNNEEVEVGGVEESTEEYEDTETTIETEVEKEPVNEEVVEEPVNEEVASDDEPNDSFDSPIAEFIDNNVDAEKRDEADPLPEVNGSYYITVGRPMDEYELSRVETRIKNAKQNYTITATGEVLVGPYASDEDAIRARIILFQKGIRGDIIEMN